MKLIIDSCVFIATFDPKSPNYPSAVKLLNELSAREILITMPAHGWFEIECTLKRLRKENKFVGPILDGKMGYPLELIHIDKKFIEKYANSDVPYLKAGDHIFVVIAKANNYPLITSDKGMIATSKKCGVNVFTPAEFLDEMGKQPT